MKIGFFITARLKSSRLKHKILLDLNGKTVLEHVIERCKKTNGIDGVVLCTSSNPQDSVLFDFAIRDQIQFYAGSEDDVLLRLLNAAKYYHYDAFVSITADNPLFSIYSSQLLIDEYKCGPFDFGFTMGLPIGLATSFIDVKALEIAVQMKKLADTEIWGPFVNRPDFFSIVNLMVQNSQIESNCRLTLDYPEDYLLMCKIFQNKTFDKFSTHSLLQLLSDNMHYLEINSMHTQRFPTESELSEINSSFDLSVKTGQEFANQLNKHLQPEFRKISIFI